MYSDNNLKKKYLKYKIKYLELKKNYLNIKGGGKPFISDYNINLFNPEIPSHILMESYLNPIYGLYMCESGFITNNYYLYDCFNETMDKIPDYVTQIGKLSRVVGTDVCPSLVITKMKPQDIGRYIAILFFCNCKDYSGFITFNQKNCKVQSILLEIITDKDIRIFLKKKIEILNIFLQPTREIKLENNNDVNEIDFHIILYYLWWLLNDITGIQSYYEGINDVISVFNTIVMNPMTNIDEIKIDYNNDNSFEKMVLDITKKQFHIYTQDQTLHFCSKTIGRNKNTYSDCGEVTARNLINLICFDPILRQFNCENLVKYRAITELIQYYKVFDSFEKQSALKTVEIYGQQLNARDAWSKLIISYACENIVFKKDCNVEVPYKYELFSGMSEDRKTTNFFQLIKNLLPNIIKWDDLNVDNKFKIKSNTTDENGIGKIIIKANDYENITIHCETNHYYMIINKKTSSRVDINNLTASQQLKINILLNDNMSIYNSDNYIWVNWSSELLVEKINDKLTDFELKKKLLQLSFTDKYDSDTRSRIIINTSENMGEFFEYFIAISNMNEKINEYTYESTDFNFVNELSNLTHLNSIITNKKLKAIDLTHLAKISSIGNGFMNGCVKLKTIDLSHLAKISSIGNDFMNGCHKLETIDLKPLLNVKSIGDNFLHDCKELTTIDFNPLSEVRSIGHSFMSKCSKLKTIDLRPLLNVTSIDEEFMADCVKLEKIYLPLLSNEISNEISIGNAFMFNCKSLKKINLIPLSNVKSIGDYFMNDCVKLETINLPHLSNITSIGISFMGNCYELKTIDLSPLLNVTSIDDEFMKGCKQLENIDLRPLSKVSSIGRNFMSNCVILENIYLPSLSNELLIESYFMSGCKQLKIIDLTPLSNVTSIGPYFMNGCESLKIINGLSFDVKKVLLVKNKSFCDLYDK